MYLHRIVALGLAGLLFAAGCNKASPVETKEIQENKVAAAAKSLKENKPEEAIRISQSVLESNADNADALAARGEARMKTHDLAGALEDLDKAIAIDSENANFYLQRARVRRDLGDSKGASADLDKSIKLNPKLAAAFYERGLLHQPEHLVADFDEAIELDPTYADAYVQRAVTLRLTQSDDIGRGMNAMKASADFEKALKLYDKAIKADPKNAELYYKRAMARIADAGPEKENLKKVMKDFDEAIKQKPDYARAYETRGHLRQLFFHDSSGAQEDFGQAVNYDPKMPEAFYDRGLARSDNRDFKGAIADFDQTIKLNPKFAPALAQRAFATLQSGKDADIKAAIDDCNAALKIAPNYPEPYTNLGLAHKLLAEKHGSPKEKAEFESEKRESLAAFKHAIELNPSAERYVHRANARLQFHDNDGAIDDSTKAIGLNPGLADPYFIRGLARLNRTDSSKPSEEERKQLKLSLDDFNKSVELAKNFRDALYYRGVVQQRLGQFDDSIENFSRAIELDPNFLEGYLGRGFAYEQAHDLPHAAADYTKAIKINPKDPRAYFSRGLLRLQLSQDQEAQQDFDAYLQLKPEMKATVELCVKETKATIAKQTKAESDRQAKQRAKDKGSSGKSAAEKKDN